MQIKNFLYNRKILLLNVILCLYVVTNLIGGERGLFAYFEKKKINAILLDEELKLSNQLNEMKKKKKLLSEQLDLDFLEILYREKLKFGKKEEVIIKLN